MNYSEFTTNGYLHKIWTNNNGDYHRVDGPAYIVYHENGGLASEEYFINGNIHRKDGPAFISYREDGKVANYIYYIGGNYLGHNTDGFWELWEHLSEDERNNSNILKILSSI